MPDGSRRSGIRPYTIRNDSPLPGVAECLYFLLVYLWQNTIQQLIAEMFGMSQAHCNQWFHCLCGMYPDSLRESGYMPESTNDGLQEILSKLKVSGQTPVLLHDGTESEVPRPVDHEDQKDRYSGRKKRHTVKNAVVTTVAGIILFAGATVPGHVHDRRMADEQYCLPPEWTVHQDTGYVGYRPGDIRSCPSESPGEASSRRNRRHTAARYPAPV